jgi:multisubunit Na+/H+ antiporter MnhG subunit
MNKKTIFVIISVVSLIGGLALGYFTDIWNDLPAIVLTTFGSTGLCISTWKKSVKKDGFVLASIICMIICGVSAAFAGMTEDNLQKLIAAVVSVVAVIAGLLTPIIANAITNKKVAQKKE